MDITQESELDFNVEDFNGFYYTNSKQIKKMDDAFVVSKIIERYPDFAPTHDENTLRQVLLVIVSNTRFVNEITEELDISVFELFSIIYRRYSFIFNGNYISKVQKAIGAKSYARKSIGATRRKSAKRKTGKRKSVRRKVL